MSENKDFLNELLGEKKPKASKDYEDMMTEEFDDSLIEMVDADGNPISKKTEASEYELFDESEEDYESEEVIEFTEELPKESTKKPHEELLKERPVRTVKSSKKADSDDFMSKAKVKVISAAKNVSDKFKEIKAKRKLATAKKEKETEKVEDRIDGDSLEVYAEEQSAKLHSKTHEKSKIIYRRKERGFGCFGGILYFLFIVCISVLLGSMGWMFASDMLGMETEEGVSVQVTVPEDFDINSITDMLYEQNIISYKFLFKFYAKLSSADQKIQPGTYELNTGSDYRALVNNMRGKRGNRVTVEVTIPEGFTMYQIFEKLEENKVCTSEELWRAAEEYDFNYDFLDKEDLGNPRRLEGYLFPDTYEFYENDTPENAISKFLDNFAVKWTRAYSERAAELGKTMDDILIIASIIEKEAGRVDEMGKVSSVIYNRLKANMTLGMESTLNYIKEGTDQELDTEVDSPYNTYMYKGLPVGAIANPGIDSIYAALYPESTGYYYFALGKDNFTHFFTNYDAFINFTNSDQYGG